MQIPEVKITCFDGLNNSGKTTQIDCLQNQLNTMGIPTVQRRGDGSRKGLGITESDPASVWWQENYRQILNTDIASSESERISTITSRKLMNELLDLKMKRLPSYLLANNYEGGVILTNRGPISRLFVARRYNPDISYEDAVGLTDDPSLAGSIPDNILVLHASKEILLNRNRSRVEGGEEKRSFNELVITRYFDDFERILDNLPPQLAEITNIIDSEKGIREVGRIALSLIVKQI